MMQLLLPVLIADVLAARPHVAATHVDHAPSVDGRLDDAAWRDAPADESFVQKFPDEGRPAAERTSVRAVYDARNLYIGVDCAQAGGVVSRLTRRDREVEADRVSVDLDTRRDGKSAFHFEVNAAGVLVDGIRFDDTELSLDWDENWEARTARTATGWSAELRIPLRILRFDEVSSQEWGIQVRRYVSRRQEIDELAYIPRSEAGEVSRYAQLGPLEDLRRGRAFELRPFALTELRRRDRVGQMLASGTDLVGSIGADLKWHVSQDVTLDATVNPDFAQVEADQVILNLTTFEQFFPEKRAFFLEGLDEFATPVTLLYTRRIGRQPDAPALPAGERLVDTPGATPIYGATKLVGRIPGRFTIGVLSAVTGRGNVLGQDMAGARASRVADPLTAFEVVRVKRDLGDNAHVGVMALATIRAEPHDAYVRFTDPTTSAIRALCPSGADVAPGARCFHDAYVSGVDFRFRSPTGAFVVAGQAAGSLIVGGPDRAVPDGTTIRSGDLAPGGSLRIAKEAGTYRFDLESEGYGRKFDPNDLGYLPRQNLVHVFAQAERHDTTPGRWLHENAQRLEYYLRYNLDGLKTSEGYQVNTSGQLKSFWSYFFELHVRPAHYDDREFGDGSALERAGLLGLESWVTTDPRRRISADLGSTTQVLENGINVQPEANVRFRVLPQLDLEVMPQGQYTNGEPRAIGGGPTPGTFLLGKQTAKELGITVRATYTFTPRLTLQTYAQLFLAAVHYQGFSTGSGRIVRLADLMPTGAPTTNPDFQEGVLNANVVLRWEYHLGATLFFVYTRSQTPQTVLDPGQRPTLDLRAVSRGAAIDVVMLKLSYWWG